MNTKSRAIPRTILTDFCRALGYDPSEVIAINAASQTIAVTTMPIGVSGIEGITTVHEIADDADGLSREEIVGRINSGQGF